MASVHQNASENLLRLPRSTAADQRVYEPAAIVDRLKLQLDDLIQAQVQQLRELSVLNRMADALGVSRTTGQIIGDTLREALRVTDARQVWLIEPDMAGSVVRVHSFPEDESGEPDLPAEAMDLFDRIVREQPEGALTSPGYSLSPESDLFVGCAMATTRHLVAVVVVQWDHPGPATDARRIRLLLSLLHQAAAASENVRLLNLVSAMLVNAVTALALAVESRDAYTGGHVTRVTAYAVHLGRKMGYSETDLAVLRLGGLLHDIGKIGVPDAVLNKPGRLEPGEFNLMKQHTVIGDQIIQAIPQLQVIAPIVRSHHERVDGRGYPDGLAGETITPLARITAIADSFDAMTSDRSYRRGMPVEKAMEEIRRGMGSQFDPDMAKAFLDCPGDELQAAAADMKRWQSDREHRDVRDVAPLLDFQRPRWHGAAG
jgi:putative nucleotidyltransferase with HDIG domain